MPNNQYNTTFNRGNANGISPGFYSRTLFMWTNLSEGYNLTGPEEWREIEDGDGLARLIDSNPTYCHGGITLPPNYWTSGKTIRFRGTFGVLSDDSQIFNMRFGLKEDSGFVANTQWLAIQNNNNNHTFARGTATEDYLPINFQCLMMCSTLDYEANAWFTANGFYKYSLDANIAIVNNNAIQVPVWRNSNTGTNGIAFAVGTNYISNETSFMMNCYNSTVADIQLLNLTIEELL